MKTYFWVAALIFSCASHAATLVVDPADSSAHRTIAIAMAQAQAGDVIRVKAGTYREQVKPKAGIVVEGEAGALVKGSDVVSGWEEQAHGVFVKRNWPVNSQQVFVDGQLLKQIGGDVFGGFPSNPNHELHRLHQNNGGIWPGRTGGDENSMPAGSFHYDVASGNLYMRPDGGTLAGKTVEVSVRPFWVNGQGVRNVALRNLSFSHANSSAAGKGGALRLIGDNLTVERVTATWGDATCLTIRGDNNVVRDSVFNHCGQSGMTASGRNNRFIGNETSHNNTRGFNKWWSAGGGKWMGSPPLTDSEIVGHRAFFNKGDGIWIDGGGRNVRIADSIAAYNEGSGIHYEISYSGQVTNNYSFGNTQRGIYIANSAETLVGHNLVANNGLEGIAVNNSPKRTATYPPNNNRILNNIIAWSGKAALKLPNTSFSNVADNNLFVTEAATEYGIWEGPSHPTVTGLTAWQAQSGQDKHSWQKLTPLPQELVAKLKQGQTDLQWTMLTTLASQLEVSDARQRPGPAK